MVQIRYPWSRWFKRRRTTLVRWSDFDCMPHVMAQQIRNRAVKEGVWPVTVRIDEDEVTIELESETVWEYRRR